MSNTAVFCFGRFQPPHIGHTLVIRKVSETARYLDADGYVFTSHSNDRKKNPLSYEDKIRFLNEIYSKKFSNISIPNVQFKTLIEICQFLQEKGYKNIVLVAGGDRQVEFDRLLNKYNGTPDSRGIVNYSFDDIKVISAGDRDPDAEDLTGASATRLRQFVSEGDFDSFKKYIDTTDINVAKSLFDAIKVGMKIAESLQEANPPQTQKPSAAFTNKQVPTKVTNTSQKGKGGNELIAIETDAQGKKTYKIAFDLTKVKMEDEKTFPPTINKVNEQAKSLGINIEKDDAWKKAVQVYQKEYDKFSKKCADFDEAEGAKIPSKIDPGSFDSVHVLFVAGCPWTKGHSEMLSQLVSNANSYKALPVVCIMPVESDQIYKNISVNIRKAWFNRIYKQVFPTINIIDGGVGEAIIQYIVPHKQITKLVAYTSSARQGEIATFLNTGNGKNLNGNMFLYNVENRDAYLQNPLPGGVMEASKATQTQILYGSKKDAIANNPSKAIQSPRPGAKYFMAGTGQETIYSPKNKTSWGGMPVFSLGTVDYDSSETMIKNSSGYAIKCVKDNKYVEFGNQIDTKVQSTIDRMWNTIKSRLKIDWSGARALGDMMGLSAVWDLGKNVAVAAAPKAAAKLGVEGNTPQQTTQEQPK